MTIVNVVQIGQQNLGNIRVACNLYASGTLYAKAGKYGVHPIATTSLKWSTYPVRQCWRHIEVRGEKMQAAWDTYQVKRSVLEGTKEAVNVLDKLVKEGKILAFRYVGTIPARGPRKKRNGAQVMGAQKVLAPKVSKVEKAAHH